MSTTMITTERLSHELGRPDYEDILEAAKIQSTEAAAHITTPETCTMARELMVDINSVVKDIEEQRVAAKAPYLDAGKKIDSLAKKLSKPLEACVDTLKAGLSVYVARVENERYQADLERQRLEALAQQTAETTGKTAPFVHVDIPVAADVAMTTVTDYEVDMNLLPKEYCLPDSVKIKAAVKAGLEIPGVTVIKRKQIVGK